MGVELLLQVLVGHEVQRLEGHVHGELGGVAPVERRRPLVQPHGAYTVHGATVRRVVHLHALLHNWGPGRTKGTRPDKKDGN